MIPQLSYLDTNRFKINCARMTGWDSPEDALDWCGLNDVALLIVRVDVAEVKKSWDLQSRGARLVDVLNYYHLNLHSHDAIKRPSDDGSLIRPVSTEDEPVLRDIGTRAFSGYFGHYHNDQLLEERRCNEAYGEWASSYSKPETGKAALALELDGAVIGLAGIRLLTEQNIVDGELFAVVPEARGRKGFSRLLDAAIAEAQDLGADTFQYSTQIQNTAVMNALHRRGFLLSKSVFTFHLWLKH